MGSGPTGRWRDARRSALRTVALLLSLALAAASLEAVAAQETAPPPPGTLLTTVADPGYRAAALPTGGGEPWRLTDGQLDEFDTALSPDGARAAIWVDCPAGVACPMEPGLGRQ